MGDEQSTQAVVVELPALLAVAGLPGQQPVAGPTPPVVGAEPHVPESQPGAAQ